MTWLLAAGWALTAIAGVSLLTWMRCRLARQISAVVESRRRTRIALDDCRTQVADQAAELAHLVRLNTELVAYQDRLLEPPVGQCRKVRLWTREEAVKFGARLSADTGASEMVPYKCQVCPRQPVSSERFWHVTHADPALRGQYWHKRSSRNALKHRVSPEQLAALKRKVER